MLLTNLKFNLLYYVQRLEKYLFSSSMQYNVCMYLFPGHAFTIRHHSMPLFSLQV